jgi:uncharacterized protein YyaL (SSP411 family)
LVEDLARLTDDVLHALDPDDPPAAPALKFLLLRYRETGGADVAAALEPQLAAALDLPFAAMTAADRAEWLMLFAAAAAITSDERIRRAVEDLLATVQDDRERAPSVAEAASAVEACFAAADVLDPHAIVPDAVDELERVIGAAYRPGGGLAHDLGTSTGLRGLLSDHVRSASALLTAYRATGRIPYAMLADELMQFAMRTLWDEEAGAFRASIDSSEQPFVLNCAAARVCCRLAGLHDNDEYRGVAVISSDADYQGRAARILAAQSARVDGGIAAAIYGLALAEWRGGS